METITAETIMETIITTHQTQMHVEHAVTKDNFVDVCVEYNKNIEIYDNTVKL